MSHISALLHEMRGRLGMYLGTTSITKLAAYLRGYDDALERLGASEEFLTAFGDWVQNRYSTTKLSWEDAILAQCGNGEVEAIAKFWELVDELNSSTPGQAANGGPANATSGKLPSVR